MTQLFEVGSQYPPERDIPRLAKYARGRAIFDGRLYEVYERASELLKDTPHAAQLSRLYIAVNLIDVLITKPADLMVGDAPSVESGQPDDSAEQVALNRIVEENDVTQLVHEIVIGAGIRGDSWLKTYYAPRHDVTETEALGLEAPEAASEPIIEAVDARYVFPELSRGSRKRFKAVNIAWVEWVDEENGIFDMVRDRSKTREVPYLNVERHVPGYIVYERYRLAPKAVISEFGVPVETFTLIEKVATERTENVVKTGINRPLVFHVPYKTVDDTWEGISGIEKIESVLAAINDRLVQIDYILWKHSDPTAYGPELDVGEDSSVRSGGKYIPVGKDDVAPGYMTWESQLDGAFKEMDVLLSIVFQMSETPQWLFGTTVSGSEGGGTGTSHTDGVAIKARFMPILSKVKRIRVHVDRALRDALWTAMELENYANEDVEGFEPYEPVYPKINWRDGIPRNEKEEAEIYQIRTGNKATVDVQSAIKRMDSVDDGQAREIMTRIDADETRVSGVVDSSIFNGGGGS